MQASWTYYQVEEKCWRGARRFTFVSPFYSFARNFIPGLFGCCFCSVCLLFLGPFSAPAKVLSFVISPLPSSSFSSSTLTSLYTHSGSGACFGFHHCPLPAGSFSLLFPCLVLWPYLHAFCCFLPILHVWTRWPLRQMFHLRGWLKGAPSGNYPSSLRAKRCWCGICSPSVEPRIACNSFHALFFRNYREMTDHAQCQIGSAGKKTRRRISRKPKSKVLMSDIYTAIKVTAK